MKLSVYPEDLNDLGKSAENHPNTKEYFLPSVQVLIEKVHEQGGSVMFYACDKWETYRAITR